MSSRCGGCRACTASTWWVRSHGIFGWGIDSKWSVFLCGYPLRVGFKGKPRMILKQGIVEGSIGDTAGVENPAPAGICVFRHYHRGSFTPTAAGCCPSTAVLFNHQSGTHICLKFRFSTLLGGFLAGTTTNPHMGMCQDRGVLQHGLRFPFGFILEPPLPM